MSGEETRAGDAGRELPRLVLVADGFTGAAVAERAVEAMRAGPLWVHLRDHAAAESVFLEAARETAERLCAAAPGSVLLSVNSRLAVARKLGAGLHTGRHGPSIREARSYLAPGALIGFSAHSVEEARGAAGADYFFFSPVFPTSSKPGHPGTGLEALAHFCQAVSRTPVFALGGLTPARVGPCLDAGAYGVAVRSGILHVDAPTRAAGAYLHALSDP